MIKISRKKLLASVSAFSIVVLFTALLGAHNIGPLSWLSTGCLDGKTKFVDNGPGERPGPYDYGCR